MKRVIYLLDNDLGDQMQFKEWVDGYHVTLRCYNNEDDLRRGIEEEVPNVILTNEFGFSIEGIKDIPVIAISHENSAIIRLHATKVHASAFYVMPPNISHLLNTVDGYMMGSVGGGVRHVILVAGFNPERNRIHTASLEELGLEARSVETAEEGLTLAMMDPDYAGILTDYKLGGEENGISLIQAIRGIMGYTRIPSVLLADTLKVEERALCMKLGGITVMPRYIDPKILSGGVYHRIMDGIKGEHTILTDGVVGLYNRVPTRKLLEVAVMRWTSGPMSLVVLELERFSDFNEEHGYELGNIVLEEMGRELLMGMGAGAIVGRCRGDQFMVLLEGMGEDEAVVLMDGMKERWGGRHGIGFRIGVVGYRMGMTALDFLNEARHRL
jgi:GGDEF domain-containing protein